jgi:hypothetical protein
MAGTGPARPGRLYLCARCQRQTLVCSHCDRGQRYCCRTCSATARWLSLRDAGRRYQNTRRGRLAHAERQRRYRTRMKKVTHHCSPPSPVDDLVVSDPMVTNERPSTGEQASPVLRERQCLWCGRRCPELVRQDFLRGRWVRRKTNDGETRYDHPP